jgi:maleate isomerase
VRPLAKRLGLLLPASNTTMERELMSYLPAGVGLHTARMRIGPVTKDELIKMSKEAPIIAEAINDCKPDILLYGCTSGSFILGKGFDVKLEEEITAVTGVPTITTSHAVLNTANRLGLKKVAIGTPYAEEVNKPMRQFFTDNGLEITNFRGLGHLDNLDIGRLSPWEAVELVKSIDSDEAEGIFLSCTNMQTMEALVGMWELFKKPIISSNFASMLEVVRMLGYPDNNWLGMDLGEQLLRRYI